MAMSLKVLMTWVRYTGQITEHTCFPSTYNRLLCALKVIAEFFWRHQIFVIQFAGIEAI